MCSRNDQPRSDAAAASKLAGRKPSLIQVLLAGSVGIHSKPSMPCQLQQSRPFITFFQGLYAGEASEVDAGPWNCMNRMSLLMPSMVVWTMLSCTTAKPDCLQKASTNAALQGTVTVQNPGGTGRWLYVALPFFSIAQPLFNKPGRAFQSQQILLATRCDHAAVHALVLCDLYHTASEGES